MEPAQTWIAALHAAQTETLWAKSVLSHKQPPLLAFLICILDKSLHVLLSCLLQAMIAEWYLQLHRIALHMQACICPANAAACHWHLNAGSNSQLLDLCTLSFQAVWKTCMWAIWCLVCATCASLYVSPGFVSRNDIPMWRVLRSCRTNKPHNCYRLLLQLRFLVNAQVTYAWVQKAALQASWDSADTSR